MLLENKIIEVATTQNSQAYNIKYLSEEAKKKNCIHANVKQQKDQTIESDASQHLSQGENISGYLTTLYLQ